MENIFDRSPDVEVVFEFNGAKQNQHITDIDQHIW